MVNAVPYQLLKRGRDIGLPCSANPNSSSIYANLRPFPPVSNQSVDYTVEGVMLDYEITPYKTEIVIAYADQNVLDDLYIKVLDFHYAKAAPFSIDVPDVLTPLLPGKYAITVIIADNPNKPKPMPVHMLFLVNDFAGTIE